MKKITILYLYPTQMNIYGDTGNVLALQRRLQWHGYQPEVIYHNPGDNLDTSANIIVGGGGQDSGQQKVCSDLLRIGKELHALANDGTPMLMICGLYQLFGHRFIPQEGEEMIGIGIFDAETRASRKRLIGNVIIQTDFGEIIGYENHSGLTTLSDNQPAFGKITRGGGNNGQDKTEGAVFNNVYGTYLHGSLLPKNPAFADELIKIAVTRAYGDFAPNKLDDSIAAEARRIAKLRPY
jgi:lipid II isoglutaminyl synthase (glutamine-hydrolysing)